MLRLTLAFALLAGAVADAAAQSRPNVSCAAARAQVAAQGAAVVHTSPTVYDRYVVSRAFCAPTQALKAAVVPTSDTPYCPLFFTCEEPSGLLFPF